MTNYAGIILGTYLSGISIKHYSRIIGSGDTFKGVVLGVVCCIPQDLTKHVGSKNTFCVISYQNVPRHRTQENFPASATG